LLPAESIIYALQRNWEMVDSALEGLDEAALARQPSDQCNSAAWILWHMTRVVDTFVHTRLRSIPQLWTQNGWHQKFDMPDDVEDRGVGWTAGQVAAWQPPAKEVQLGYYAAIKSAATEYLESLTVADLEKTMVIPPVAEPRSVAMLLGQFTWDNVAHGGQIAYLRGLFIGMGWHR
jgi:hypothetical protein